jgi:hypothetical protein
MKELDIEFYNDVSELPFSRFNSFNKYVMLDAELGNTIQDFDKMVSRISEFMDKEMKEDAKRELLNMRIVYHNILHENDVKGLAFASMIKKYKGKPVDDFSEEKLKELLVELSSKGLTIKDVADKNSDLKKK